MKKNLKLDQKGYAKLLREMTNAEKELHNLRFYKNSKVVNEGNKWYDQPEVYQNFLLEQTLLKKIKMLKEQLTVAKIIERKSSGNTVDIDDIIKLSIFNEQELEEEMLIKLVGGIADFKINPQEVSINSPLGDAIYQQIIGNNVKYTVGDKTYSVIIEEKMTEMNATLCN